MVKQNSISISSRSLKYKLRIAFYLMSVLPLLVCIYISSNYISPYVGFNLGLTIVILISIIIAIIGLLVIKEVFDRIVAITNEARLMASGDLSRKLEIQVTDEVGVLGDALNRMTQRIRSNMGELKSYSEKTTEINIEIQKRVVVLSSMLQMSYLIAQGAKLEEVLKLATEKSRLLANSDIAYLFFRERGEETFCMKAADGVSAKQLLKISIDSKDELFNRVISANKPLIIDSQNILPRNLITVLQERFNLNNTFALPVYLRGEVIAILGIGNTREAFTYRKEDEELLDIFAKQIAIAVENDILVRRLEKLEIKDALTGLYNEAFIRSRLQEEIKRAIMYQRPCAFLVFDIDDFTKFREAFGSLQAEAILKKIAFLIKDSISEIDRSGRTADNEFSIILPEKNKRQAQAIAENIRKKIEYSFSEEKDPARKITISGGVSENPLDGVDAEQLLSKAKELLSFAKEQGKNRVVSFKEPPVC